MINDLSYTFYSKVIQKTDTRNKKTRTRDYSFCFGACCAAATYDAHLTLRVKFVDKKQATPKQRRGPPTFFQCLPLQTTCVRSLRKAKHKHCSTCTAPAMRGLLLIMACTDGSFIMACIVAGSCAILCIIAMSAPPIPPIPPPPPPNPPVVGYAPGGGNSPRPAANPADESGPVVPLLMGGFPAEEEGKAARAFWITALPTVRTSQAAAVGVKSQLPWSASASMNPRARMQASPPGTPPTCNYDGGKKMKRSMSRNDREAVSATR